MSVYLSHGIAAIIGGVVQYALGRFLRTVVIEQVREKRNGKPLIGDRANRILMISVVSVLMLLGLAGIVTTYVVIQRYERAISCDQVAIVENSRSTAAMLDKVMDPKANLQIRQEAIQKWRIGQDETIGRIEQCE